MTAEDPWSYIPREEYRDRQRRARLLAQENHLDGFVVYSKGGGFMDMSADVLYLANYYSNQPYVADHAGIGTARSHGVVVLPVDGPTVVIADVPWLRQDLVVSDDLRHSIFVTERVSDVLTDTNLRGKRVGLVGASNMSAAAYEGLITERDDTAFVRFDEAIESLRIHKSDAEQRAIRKACEVGNAAMDAMMGAVQIGSTEGDAVGAATQVIAQSGAIPYDFLFSSGPRAHYVAYGRLPSHDVTRAFEFGDMVKVDSFGAYAGYLWDFARTGIVGEPNDRQAELADALIEGVHQICANIRPGSSGGELWRVGEEWLSQNSAIASLPQVDTESEGFPAVGHGLGLSWENPWMSVHDETEIEAGMYLAVELFAGHESVGGAMFEQNGLVTNTGFEILTTAKDRWW